MKSVNVSHAINAAERRVGQRVLAAGEARVMTLTRLYDADVDDVWDACTSAERIPRWFLPVSGELRVGGHYALQGNASGTIQECDPPRRFAATWEFGGEVSWIEVRLTPEADGRTRLQLEHTAHVDDERWAQFGPGAVGVGWELASLGLAEHLETHARVDPEAAAAWTMSPEGHAFIAQSSDGWCTASIQVGTEPEAARAAAQRTTAFYTGTGDPASAQPA